MRTSQFGGGYNSGLLDSCIDSLLKGIGDGIETDDEEPEDEIPLWEPDSRNEPQQAAYESDADEIYYGGEPGGGKSDLLLGLATTRHRKSLILRRQATQLQELVERLKEIVGYPERGHWRSSGHGGVMRTHDGRIIELAGCDEENDKQKFKGRPHDLKGYDEGPDFAESQYTFINIWNRTTIAGQRCRVVLGGNPPTTAEGEWVLRRWAAWLDPKHHNPAVPGELRWYAMVDGKEVERPDGTPFEHDGDSIQPRSRTFIRAKLKDNVFLDRDGGYRATLQALPEPLRSIFLKGDFAAGRDDDPWQIIPTAWVDAAMARWAPGLREQMDAMGVDVARGGKDTTVIAPRHGLWFGEVSEYPGSQTTDGKIVAELVLAHQRDRAFANVDIIGVGASAYDILVMMGFPVFGINFSEGAEDALGHKMTDRSGQFKMRNLRAAVYWHFRELLDPHLGVEIALPPDKQLRADLCAPRWSITMAGILVESKEEIKKRLGRSTNRGDAVVLAAWMPLLQQSYQSAFAGGGRAPDPFVPR